MLSFEALHALTAALHDVECEPGSRTLPEWSPGHQEADQRRAKAVYRHLSVHGLQIRPVGDGERLSEDVLAEVAA